MYEDGKKPWTPKVIKGNEAIRGIRNFFEEEEDYFNQKSVDNVYGNIYMTYEINGHRNKTPSLQEYLNEIELYLKDSISNFRTFDTWKVQLTMTSNFISSVDNDEEPVMHSNSEKKEIMIYDKADEVVETLNYRFIYIKLGWLLTLPLVVLICFIRIVMK